jgi:hypothetical protein
MRLKRSRRVMGAAIPTASMADIAFLLIIFFMVTTAYSLDRTPMELPQTTQQEQTAKGAAIIAITEDETYRFSEGEADTRVVEGAAGARCVGPRGAGRLSHHRNSRRPYICSSVLVGMTRFCTPIWRSSSNTSVIA